MNANTAILLAALSRSLSRLDNARSAHVRRCGFSADVAAKARRLEEKVLATRSPAVLAEIEAYATELFAAKTVRAVRVSA